MEDGIDFLMLKINCNSIMIYNLLLMLNEIIWLVVKNLDVSFDA